MPIINAVPGENVITNVQFTDEDDDPVMDITGPVKYRVWSPDGQLLISSTATIDGVDSSLYVVNFTIPANTPPSNNTDKAKLVVAAKDSSGNIYNHKEWFTILSAGDDAIMSQQKNIIATQTATFSSTFVMPADLEPDTVTFTIFNDAGSPMVVRQNPTSTIVGQNRIYKVIFPANHGYTPSNSYAGAYLCEWRAYGGDLIEDEVETVNLYIINKNAGLLLENMRAMLDKGILQNIHNYLSWDAVTFIQHLNRGFDYVNSILPRITDFSINKPLPTGLTYYIEMAGALSALRAQYLAESQTANFDFQGLGVQLNVDRLTGLDAMINQLETAMAGLPDAKKNWVQSGSPTNQGAGSVSNKLVVSSSIVLSEATNFVNINVLEDAILEWGGIGRHHLGNLRRRSRL